MTASRAWYVVALLCLLGLMSYIDRLALSLLVEPIRADLGVDDTRMGLLMGPAFALFYASMAFPVAWAIDRVNRVRVLAGGVILWSVSTSAAAFAPDFNTLFLLRMGVGIGEAVLSPAVASLIGDLFARERRPTPIGAVMSAQTIGAGASFVLVGALLSAVAAGQLAPGGFLAGLAPWRITLFFVGLPGLVLATILLLSVREPDRGRFDSGPTEAAREDSGAFSSRRKLWWFFGLFLLGGNLASTTLYVTAFWFPTHLIRAYGLPASQVGFEFGMVTLVSGGIGALALSAIAERLALRGRKDALLWLAMGAIPIILALFLLACHAPAYGLALGAITLFQLLGNGVGAIPTVVIASLAGTRMRGRLAAVHLLFQAILPSSLAPVLVGRLSDKVYDGQIGPALVVVALICYPAALLLFLTVRRAYAEASYGRG